MSKLPTTIEIKEKLIELYEKEKDLEAQLNITKLKVDELIIMYKRIEEKEIELNKK